MERMRPGSNGARSDFAKDVYRSFLGEFEAITSYAQGAIMLAGSHPAVARLLDEISRVEMSHFEQLGQLLMHLGACPNLNLRLRQEPLRSGTDPNGVAVELLRRSLSDERAAEAEYRRLAQVAPGEAVQNMLLEISGEEAGHATAIEGMLKRLGGA